ncbi:hypothetical protein VU04_03785 [Desulfobulbus sp. TB]|nr:hypothetical protein [Desulfobulbus sp. TB]
MLFVLPILPLLPVRAQAQTEAIPAPKLSKSSIPLTVDVQGIKGEEYENVMASIKIVLQQKKPGLTLRHIHRIHKAAPEQISNDLAPLGCYSVEVELYSEIV